MKIATQKTRPQDLRATVRLQRLEKRPDAVDDWSEEQPRWRTVKTLKASIRRYEGAESVGNSQIAAVNAYRISTRYFRDVRPADRFLNAATGEIYYLESIAPDDEEQRWLTITATKSDR